MIKLAFIALLASMTTAMSQINERTIDKLFHDFSGNHPGAAVMIIRDGKPIFERAYGMADVEHKVPCSTSTDFRLASVTKQFTAMGIMILAEHRKLSLDDKLSKFFPNFPNGNEITVRHLLTHTSGIKDYEDLIPADATKQVKDLDVLHLVSKEKETYFPIGSKFRYSNSAYALLALIIQRASGQTYAHYLKANIFDPLEMTSSVAYEPGISKVPNRAFGYAKENGVFKPSDQSTTSAVLGDGGIYSSVEDLFKWDQALYTEKLVSKKMLKDAFTVHSANSDFPGSGYGYGWYLAEYKGTEQIWHYGSTCGFNTKIERFPEKKTTIIVLTNRHDAGLSELTPKLVSLILDH